MKRLFAITLVLALLLCGCAKKLEETTPPTTDPSPTTQATAPTEPSTELPTDPATEPQETLSDLGSYQPDSQIELLTDGAVRMYRLEPAVYHDVALMGDGLLLFSGEEATTLTYVCKDAEPVSVTLEGVRLAAQQIRCCSTDPRVGYFDPNDDSVVILDKKLQEISRVEMPEDMVCDPVLSPELDRAYYFDGRSLRYLDMKKGISRMLTDSSYEYQEIVGLHFGGTVLECCVFNEDMEGSNYRFISTADGQTLDQLDTPSFIQTHGEWYLAQVYEGFMTRYLFGQRGEEPQVLVPEHDMMTDTVPELQGLLVSSYEEDGTALQLYDTGSGTRKYEELLPGLTVVSLCADQEQQAVWILGEDREDQTRTLYRWDLEESLTGDEEQYVTPYYTEEDPDLEGLDRIAREAAQLGDRFGVKIAVYKEAIGYTPSDYIFEAEHMVSVYDYYLPILEKALSAYPEGMLKKLGTASGNGRVTISLVRAAYGDSELGALDMADGVQFWENGNAYVTLVMCSVMHDTVFHELFHVIDTYVLTETLAFDDWDSLNPEGFVYDNDYLENQYRDEEEYLEEDTRAFIDLYSMSYAKEDRARVMEYAMMENNERYFSSPVMQQKLRTICEGVREAFGLETGNLWEQYLQEPLRP